MVAGCPVVFPLVMRCGCRSLYKLVGALKSSSLKVGGEKLNESAVLSCVKVMASGEATVS